MSLILRERKGYDKRRYYRDLEMGKGTATGKVKNTFDHEITTTIKGIKVTRKGNPGNKALFIQQENGAEVLKLESEVQRLD